ncbi:MAG: glycosyltransferase family 1 protein [Rhodospirillales bacterium]|nr:glycosyltransferase family 1 protein [Alphaproteobacteria bacterium]USO03705.1 MAG: glycosyltransferase family 1 protein [Rhodospirillales bacterium]
MKILIVSDAWHPQINGVVRTYEQLSHALAATGHDVKIIGPADFPLRMPLPGYPEIRLALFPYMRLKKLITAAAPDQIHIATEGPLGQAARRYCLKHAKTFTTAYHSRFPDFIAVRVNQYVPLLAGIAKKYTARLLRRFHAPAKVVMVSTQSLQDELTKTGFCPPMVRLTRGVDTGIFYPGPKTLFHALKKPVALYAGRIAIEKNINAFLDMPWHGDKVVAGYGPDLEKLKKKYPHVHFTGKKTGEALAEHYRSADVFVFPSKTDTFGMVLIEALACGLPVAAYNVMGPRDVITEDFLGALDDDLSRAAMKALTTGSANERHAHIRTHYTWDKAARQFLDAL